MPQSFDAYARDYDAALNQGLSVSGESKDYFASGRIHWLAQHIQPPRRIMDFGCGTGSATPFLLSQWPSLDLLLGTDVSTESLDLARQQHTSNRVQFQEMRAYPPDASLDLVFCNGVFHHIPPNQRPSALKYVYDSLKPGGHFALWENNPWNPGTRWIMSRIPFDRDAILLWPREARRLLRSAGLQVVRTDFLFIFPRLLRFLRPLERFATKLPLGGQYLVLARK